MVIIRVRQNYNRHLISFWSGGRVALYGVTRVMVLAVVAIECACDLVKRASRGCVKSDAAAYVSCFFLRKLASTDAVENAVVFMVDHVFLLLLLG
jgi:hypothetical protein